MPRQLLHFSFIKGLPSRYSSSPYTIDSIRSMLRWNSSANFSMSIPLRYRLTISAFRSRNSSRLPVVVPHAFRSVHGMYKCLPCTYFWISSISDCGSTSLAFTYFFNVPQPVWSFGFAPKERGLGNKNLRRKARENSHSHETILDRWQR